jgi:hypothetical protein
MEIQENDKEVQILKTNIGFGTAFKATLGFYTAQVVATLVGLLVLGGIIAVGLVIVYFLNK